MEINKEKLSFYPEHLIDYQYNRYCNAAKDFKNAFGYEADSVFSTPGRSEICGNHTDHNLGKAVGASINLDMLAFVVLFHFYY